MFQIIEAGLQTTLQGAQRLGYRHLGIPYAGPADALSMAIANRLVDNPPDATCLEITYGGFEVEIETACTIAVTGAGGDVLVSGAPAPMHQTLHVQAGARLKIAPSRYGARTYLAVHSGFRARLQFGATSTYLPAQLGGHQGRALRSGDVISAIGQAQVEQTWQIPDALRPLFDGKFALRATISAETELLDDVMRETLFSATFIVGRQATRMGISLEGHPLSPASDGMMKSAPVFPGTIQCPPSGIPIALLCDAQTTGGYPRIASIARCDRHQLGQLRPGDQVRLLHRTPEQALVEYEKKQALLNRWLARGA